MQSKRGKESFSIFSISWAPGDDTRFATSNALGEIIIWDYTTGKMVCKIQPGIENRILKVAWNPLRKNTLACGSSENKAFIINLENNKMKVINVYSHNDIVNGVAWSPLNKYFNFPR